MNRFLLSLLTVLFLSAPAMAASYDVRVRSADGADTAHCGPETACTGSVALAGHKPIQFTMESSAGMLVLTFFQDGYHLPVHPAGNSIGSSKAAFVVKADTVKAGMIVPLTVYAPDAGNLRPSRNDPNPKTMPVAIEITLTQVTR